jgi:hypothetical protein
MSRSYSASMRRKFWRLVTAIACLETQITTPAQAYDWAHKFQHRSVGDQMSPNVVASVRIPSMGSQLGSSRCFAGLSLTCDQ